MSILNVPAVRQSQLDAMVQAKINDNASGTRAAIASQISAANSAAAIDPLQPWKDGVQAQKAAPAIWVNLGDSIANGGNGTTWSRNWLWRVTVRYTDRLPNRLDDTTLVAAPTTGVAVYTGAVGGRRSSDYLTDALVTRIGTLQPKLVTHLVGTNDYGAAVAPATYKANLRAWYDKILAVAPGASHVFIHAPERLDGTANAYKWADYRDQLLALKAEIGSNKVTVFDMDAEFRKYGPAGTSDRYKLWDTDNLHFANKGNKVQADLIANFIGAPHINYLPREVERGLTKPAATVTTNTVISSFVVKAKPYLREGVIKFSVYAQTSAGSGDLILSYGIAGQADADYASFRISSTVMNYGGEMFASFEPNTEYTVKLTTEVYAGATFQFAGNARFFYFAADLSPA